MAVVREELHTAPLGLSPQARPKPPATLVPVAAIPIVVIVLGLLMAAIATDSLWAINAFHVVGGGLWTGVDLFVGFIIGPILGRMSIAARMEFTTRFMPKMVLLVPTLVTMTLASGWQLASHLGLLETPYPQHWWLVASFIVVGIMAVAAIGILEPANIAVLFELRKDEPDTELIARLMRRFVYVAAVTGVMQIATLTIMTRIATW